MNFAIVLSDGTVAGVWNTFDEAAAAGESIHHDWRIRRIADGLVFSPEAGWVTDAEADNA